MRTNKGFTLIELLVVISIIGLIMALSIFGLLGARESGRDATRKVDLARITDGLEIYRSDCNTYPVSLGTVLTGDGSTASCSAANTYLSKVPTDPLPGRQYEYSSNGTTYELCAALEGGTGTVTCGGSSSCGTGATCNYKVTNP